MNKNQFIEKIKIEYPKSRIDSGINIILKISIQIILKKF